MLKEFVQEAQPQKGFFVGGVELDTCFGVGEAESIVLVFDVGERSVGVIDG